MNPYKTLGHQAIIYGLGNIIPRILNYVILTAYYTRRFTVEEYGVITELYAYVAIMIVILTYGMETALFKFSIEKKTKEEVYTSALFSVSITSLIFIAAVIGLRLSISEWIGYKSNTEYIINLGGILGIDAVSSIIFAKLRIENKIRRFALLKILNILLTILFVFFFLEFLPKISFYTSLSIFGRNLKDIGVGYVFISNLLASAILLFFLSYELKGYKISINLPLLKKMLIYALPLMIAGLAGMFNEAIDRILLKKLVANNLNPLYEIGIYGANYRIAVLMTIFVQMFRYAAEPFFFNQFKEKDAKEVYANVLKYFTIFLMLIFLGVSLFIDVFKHFIDERYYEGLGIVPIVLLANVFVGMLFNINMWYKLTGHTIYGVLITGGGAILTVILNIVFIPIYSYIACAWIHLSTNLCMLLITYYYGQRFYKIKYDLKSITIYFIIGLSLFFIGNYLRTEKILLNIVVGSVLLLLYFGFCEKREKMSKIFLKKYEN